MKVEQPDELIDALRADVCGADKQAEVRARLVARGVLSASAVSTATAATAASATAQAQATLGAVVKGATGASTAAAGKALTWTTSSKLLLSFAVASAATIGTASLSRTNEAKERAPTEQALPTPAATQRVEAIRPAAGEPPHEAPGSHLDEQVERRPVSIQEPRTRDTLKEESALLRRAVESIHARDFSRAERLLDRHEQTYPNGVLGQERELARGRLQRERDAERP